MSGGGSAYSAIPSACTTYCTGRASRAESPGTPNRPRNTGRRRSKKKARETVRDGPGHRADALDGASHTVGWDAKGSRCPRGRPATALAALSRRRFHPLRALLGDASGCRLCDRPNGDIPTGLPGHLRHKYGRIIVTLDNSACHKPKEAV